MANLKTPSKTTQKEKVGVVFTIMNGEKVLRISKTYSKSDAEYISKRVMNDPLPIHNQLVISIRAVGHTLFDIPYTELSAPLECWPPELFYKMAENTLIGYGYHMLSKDDPDFNVIEFCYDFTDIKELDRTIPLDVFHDFMLLYDGVENLTDGIREIKI